MKKTSSKNNEDSIYIKENKIEGHGKPIPTKQLIDIIKKGENAMVKIKYIEVKGTGFFFKQNISSIKYNNKYFLMTNNHVLNQDFFNDNTHLEIEHKKKQKIIPLNNRIKYTNEELDFTIIEILPTDDFFSEIKYFFTIDNYIMSNNSESKYLKKDICIFQYPNGEKLSFDKGQIKSINDYQIKHLVSTEPGSSGSPILLLNDFTIIGIHQAGKKNKEDNKGIFMKNILNDINNISSEENIIVCEYDIKKGKDDKEDYLNQIIINSFEEAKRNYDWIKEGTNNEDEIKENCELYLDNNKIDFSYKYEFPKDGKYTIQIIVKNPLSNTNHMSHSHMYIFL